MEKSDVSPRKNSHITGLKNNDYAVTSWTGYYEQSLNQAEVGVSGVKDSWFKSNHDYWRSKNDKLESAHLTAELLSQKQDPREAQNSVICAKPDVVS